MQPGSWKAKFVQGFVIYVAFCIGARIAYEAAKPVILPILAAVVLVAVFALLLRFRRR